MVKKPRFTQWVGSQGLVFTADPGGPPEPASLSGAFAGQAQAAIFAAAGTYAAAVATGVPSSADLRLLSSSDALLAYYRAENNVTLSPTLNAFGTSPPVVTLSGNLNQCTGLCIRFDSSTIYRWGLTGQPPSTDGSGLWLGTGTIPQGGSVLLGDITVHFPVGTYNTGHMYCTTVDSIGNLTAATGRDLTTSALGSTVIGPYAETAAMNNVRPALKHQPNIIASYLAEQSGGVGSGFAGTNKSFHTFHLAQITQTNISTLPVALWSASSAASSTHDYLYSIFYGPEASGGQRHVSQKRAVGATAVAINHPLSLDFPPHVFEHRYDAGVMRFLVDGIQVSEQAFSSAALTTDRFVMGGVKLGSGAISTRAFMRWSEFAMYNRALTDAEADDVRRRVVGA